MAVRIGDRRSTYSAQHRFVPQRWPWAEYFTRFCHSSQNSLLLRYQQCIFHSISYKYRHNEIVPLSSGFSLWIPVFTSGSFNARLLEVKRYWGEVFSPPSPLLHIHISPHPELYDSPDLTTPYCILDLQVWGLVYDTAHGWMQSCLLSILSIVHVIRKQKET
jgi:hypothetical protein